MFLNRPLARILGFPIQVKASFLILLALVLFFGGGGQGLALVLLAFGSVVLHELGHALVARHLGVAVSHIELHFFGGTARLTDQPRSAGDEIIIAAAGPAVSFALAGIGYGLAAITGTSFLTLLGWVNLAIALFNLLPAFPSDGGRILRALLARKRGLIGATEMAVRVGRVVCIALAGLGLLTGAYQVVAVAAVLWLMGGAERLAVRTRGDDRWRSSKVADSVEYLPPDPRRSDPGAASPFLGSGPRVVVFRWRS